MEDNNRIGSIIAGLSPEAQKQLEAQATNFDDVFQSGGNANNFSAAIAGANSILTGQIVEVFMAKVIGEVTNHLAEAIVKILSVPSLGDLGQEIGAKFNEYIITFNEYLNLLSFNTDEKMRSALDNVGNEAFDKINKFANEKVNDLTNKINEKIDATKIKEKLDSILKYAAQGTAWVDNNLTSLANNIVQSANGEIDKVVESAEEMKMKMVNNAIDKAAKIKADKVNEETKKAAKKYKDDIEYNANMAITMAQTKATNAINDILARLGIT